MTSHALPHIGKLESSRPRTSSSAMLRTAQKVAGVPFAYSESPASPAPNSTLRSPDRLRLVKGDDEAQHWDCRQRIDVGARPAIPGQSMAGRLPIQLTRTSGARTPSITGDPLNWGTQQHRHTSLSPTAPGATSATVAALTDGEQGGVDA